MAAANGQAQQQQPDATAATTIPVQPIRYRRHIQQAHQHHHHASPHLQANTHHQNPSSSSSHLQHACSSSSNAPSTAFRQTHSRRQSVARLLPDISKLRLLAWLIEASNELVNCDIAIMEGVYASKLNRSRESLLFWAGYSGGSSNQQQLSVPGGKQPAAEQVNRLETVISAKTAGKHISSSSNHNQGNVPPPRPPRPVTAQRQQQQHQPHLQQGAALKGRQVAAAAAAAAAARKQRHHFTMPLERDSPASSGSQVTNPKHQGTNQKSLCATVPAKLSSSGPRSLPVQQRGPANNNCDTKYDDQVDADDDNSDDNDDDDDCDDDDDSSSAASSNSSTASSGVHALSSSSSSTADSSASSADSSLMHLSPVQGPKQQVPPRDKASGKRVTGSKSTQASGKTNVQQKQQASADEAATGADDEPEADLGEKIRRTVVEHNYMLSLLVNVIRQHDRLRLLAKAQQQQQQMEGRGYDDDDRYAAPNAIKRIDLAEIAEALDDGCQCECHSRRVCRQSISNDDSVSVRSGHHLSPLVLASLQQQPLTKAASLKSVKSAASGGSTGGKTRLTVPLKKVRKLNKKLSRNKGGNSNDNDQFSREDMIRQLADKLCENCFDTHFWLYDCWSLTSNNDLMPSTSTLNMMKCGQHLHDNRYSTDDYLSLNDLNITDGSSMRSSSINMDINNDIFNDNISLNNNSSGNNNNNNNNVTDYDDSIVALRNATFIKLVQQQVRSTISKSIELIDLIRKEIKSPESIKQKQLMKCFSASIQLLTSVSNYVVPTQDISSFIPETFGHEQTQLYCLPSEDFDHLLRLSTSSNSNSNHQVPSRMKPPVVTVTGSSPKTATATNSMTRSLLTSTTGDNRSMSNVSITSSSTATTTTSLPQMFGRSHQQMLMMNNSTRSMPSAYHHGGPPYAYARQSACLSATIDNHHHYHLPPAPEIPIRRCCRQQQAAPQNRAARYSDASDADTSLSTKLDQQLKTSEDDIVTGDTATTAPKDTSTIVESSSSGASSKNSSASSSIARGAVQQSSCARAIDTYPKTGRNNLRTSKTAPVIRSYTGQRQPQPQPSPIHQVSSLPYFHQRSPPEQHNAGSHLSFETIANLSRQQSEASSFLSLQATRPKFWQSPKFNFIKKLLRVKEQRLLRQQSKDRRIYNSKVQNKFRLVMMDLTHFNRSQQLLATENGVNSLLTSMRNVLEFGLYLTLKLY